MDIEVEGKWWVAGFIGGRDPNSVSERRVNAVGFGEGWEVSFTAEIGRCDDWNEDLGNGFEEV